MSTFIAISPHGVGGYYGVGESVEDAKAKLKEHGGNLVRYVVVLLPAGAEKPYVDDRGTVNWTWAEGADQTATIEVIHKRGLTMAA